MPTTDPRITKAKKVGAKAVKEAAEQQTKVGVNRSTATRAAYKIKAQALDEILEILGPPKAAPKASSNGARGSRSAAKAATTPRPKGTTARASKRVGARKR